MPKDLPKASDLWEGRLSFFSLDTDLIQSAGYNFKEGELHQLPAKLPVAMQLQLTEIVVQEVVKHQLDPVQRATDQLSSAINDIKRITPTDTTAVSSEIDKLQIVSEASRHFRQLIEDYAEKCHGGILPLAGEDLAKLIFDQYFKGAPHLRYARIRSRNFLTPQA